MAVTGNVQAFILGVMCIGGFFAYVLVLTATGREPNTAILASVTGVTTLAATFFFGSHLANGAAAKALDVLLASRGETIPPQPDAGNIKVRRDT